MSPTCDRRRSRRVLHPTPQHPRVAGRQRREHGGGQPSLRRERLDSPSWADEARNEAEVKNVNSFRYLEKALEYEITRQIDLIEGGGKVVPGDAALGHEHRSHALDAQQGRSPRLSCFPEPDLPLLVDEADRTRALDDHRSCQARSSLRRGCGIDLRRGRADAVSGFADYFEATPEAAKNAKAASNWIMGELLRMLNERGREISDVPIQPAALAGLIALIDKERSAVQSQGRVRECATRGDRRTTSSARKGLHRIPMKVRSRRSSRKSSSSMTRPPCNAAGKNRHSASSSVR